MIRVLTLASAFVVSLLLFVGNSDAKARGLPSLPTAADDPGSNNYPYPEVKEISESFSGRSGTLYLPKRADGSVPTGLVLIAFGHGYRVPQFTYEGNFQHWARKGYAVLYVPYDVDKTDRNFGRMAEDYRTYVEKVATKHADVLDLKKILFSGHSNGATVALAAAASAAKNNAAVLPRAVVTVAVNGPLFRRLHTTPIKIPVVLIVGEDDTDDPPAESQAVYAELAGPRELVVLRSYKQGFEPQVIANHGSIRTIGWLGNQTSPLHYYGYWKLILGLAQDVNAGCPGDTPWVYGPAAADTGVPGLSNSVTR